ncbi:unnamed protein product [Adineta ricciae]|uniref:B box-type domain-containing protein n=1 Tax=Adineta ricciae TaxID=249248 RepID=A0A814GX67_ADIRI|nr:unnamed protein product [Adineta ricciae]CAF1002590.1 unnamed protein product [Adineta ricciae]
MASSTDSTKVSCAICKKAKGQFKCEGCSQTFCPNHSIEHRNELSKQFDEIVFTYDSIQQALLQQTQGLQQHPLVQKLNQWEADSILKIQQVAQQLRNELSNESVQRTSETREELQQVSNELKQGREDNDYSEIELRKWIQKLESIEKELLNPTNACIYEDSAALVRKISIVRQGILDRFDRTSVNGKIEENGYVVTKDNLSGHIEVRGKNEYTTGSYTLRFQVDYLIPNGWIFFGIISNFTPMKNESFASSTTYGWSNRHQTYTAGNLNNPSTLEVLEGDVIVLLINCDEQTIEMTNERLNRTQKLPIDTQKCLFPWQLHLNLHAPNTKVRILFSSV